MVKLFSCLKITKGFGRALIIDFQRADFELIDSNTADHLTQENIDSSKIPVEILNELYDKEIIFDCPGDFQLFFPSIEENIYYPAEILFGLVYLQTKDEVQRALEGLKLINIKNVRFFLDKLSIEEIKELLPMMNFSSVEIIVSEDIPDDFIEQVNDKWVTINLKKEFKLKYPQLMINQELYFESLNQNTFFSKKLIIDKKGEIKRALEDDQTFGNILEIHRREDFEKIYTNFEFKKYWNIPKKNCDVCNECEFRNMCVDNRIPLQRNKTEWFYKTECDYNPYINKWKNDAGYKTLSECGVVSNLSGFSIDLKTIEKINEELWC
jgi:hypothetical protein